MGQFSILVTKCFSRIKHTYALMQWFSNFLQYLPPKKKKQKKKLGNDLQY